ncbi:MAG: thioredoxin-disulfide reductase [Bdellovibrionaceae bacterium]|nr:thioredoxin-disulfide reductase [Pseudobdellovibrionaceae bacterium]
MADATSNAADKVENVIIIGSGPAGLTAAVYTARARLNPLMIEGEEAGGQLMTTTEVENYPGFEHGVTGPALIEVMRKQAERFGTRFMTRNVTAVDFSQRPFKVTAGKHTYFTKSIIISTGAKAKYLGLESERKYMNRGVSACATCDGAFFKDVEVAVVGGGDTAMEEANFLTRFAKTVHLLHRRDTFRASKIMAERTFANPQIKIHYNTEVTEVKGDDRGVNGLVLRDTANGTQREMPVQGLFLAIGHKPSTDLFKDVIELDEVGYIKTKPGSSYTNIPGVFAAGDVQDSVYRQAITAAGTGCMAAIDVERWLEANH